MFPSDLSDAEWALVAPLIPPGRRGERQRSVDEREVLDAIFYRCSRLAATGFAERSDPEEHGAFSRTQAVKDGK